MVVSASPGPVRRVAISTGVVISSRTGRGLRVGAAERHFAQDVALGEDSGNPVFGVDYGYRTDVVVEHLIDGVGYAGLQRNRCDFPVTKFQHAHKYLLRRLLLYNPCSRIPVRIKKRD